MRIAHVITRLILGGAQENTLLSCEGLLRDYGDDVLLITGPPLGPEGSLLERARANGVPLQIVPELRRAIHPWRDANAYRQLKRALREFRPDVVHTHSGKAGLLGRAAAWSLRVPAVVHGVHGAPFHPYQHRLAREFFRRCERWAARRCHAFVSVADAMTDLMVDAGVAPRSAFTTIYSGMEVDPFLRADQNRDAMRRQLGFHQDDIVIGKVARLFHLKGHADVIRAADELASRHKQMKFLFVGDGVLRTELERQISAAGLAERFRFAGLVPAERIPDYLGAVDLVVHASLREGLARVLPQALLAGKPAISYDIDGAREAVLHERTGLLVPPRNVAGLAAALDRLIVDRELRERLAAAGREHCRERFRHEKMTAELRTLYVKLLGKS